MKPNEKVKARVSRDTNEPQGKLTPIPDFLPSPEELLPREETIKITIALDSKCATLGKIEVLSVADLFGEAIQRGFNNQSISSLFDVDKG